MDPNCPLCGENPIPGTAGAILGEMARRERQRAELLDQENRELNRINDSLRGELKIAMDALHAMSAPRSAPAELHRVDAPLQLPPG